MMTNRLSTTVSLSLDDVRVLYTGCVLGEKVHPEIVEKQSLRAAHVYKRFAATERKDGFRKCLLAGLMESWTPSYGYEQSKRFIKRFHQLVETINEEGALVFTNLISKTYFAELIEQYDQLMSEGGSTSLIHSYLNLRNYPEFLANQLFNSAFLHPLIITVMAYQIGAPIRIVDARAKDAEPLTVRAQDNMLHIDNTPFNDEYKILLTWEKHRVSGPKGQNFVYLPGTHKGARNCYLEEDGTIWSTENASIFVTSDSIEQAFKFQRKVRNNPMPTVVEVNDNNNPTTILFAAGSLIHHRFRTNEGHSRSSLIIAYHSAFDSPGGLLEKPLPNMSDVLQQLLVKQEQSNAELFISVLTAQSNSIAQTIEHIFGQALDGPRLIEQHTKQLSSLQVQGWKEAVLISPEIEEIKFRAQHSLLGQELDIEEFVRLVAREMMFYDKHGPLDLILYADAKEEVRKWSRNRIREMKLSRMEQRLSEWVGEIDQPQISHILPLHALVKLAKTIIRSCNEAAQGNYSFVDLDYNEQITCAEAVASLSQIVSDLSEAIMRCYSFQNYLSTSLFLFWACDECIRLISFSDLEVRDNGGAILRSYIASSIVHQQFYEWECSQRISL
jgi:hypothetical protein